MSSSKGTLGLYSYGPSYFQEDFFTPLRQIFMIFLFSTAPSSAVRSSMWIVCRNLEKSSQWSMSTFHPASSSESACINIHYICASLFCGHTRWKQYYCYSEWHHLVWKLFVRAIVTFQNNQLHTVFQETIPFLYILGDSLPS